MDATSVIRDIAFDRLCKLVAPIARKHKINKMYLFGSRARNEFDSDSDYDIYVVSDEITSLIHLSSLILDLKDALNSEVDVVIENECIGNEFLKEVLRDRRLVYEA